MNFEKLTKNKKIENLKICVYGNPGLEKSRYSMNGLKNAIVMDIDHGLSSVDNEDLSIHVVPTDPTDKMSTMNSYNKLMDYLKTDKNKFDTLVIDIFSKYSDILAKVFMDIDEASWGSMYSSNVEEKLNDLMALPMTVIVLFHEGTTEDNGRLKKSPMMVGSKVKDKVPGMFDVVLRAEVSQREEDQGRAILSWTSRDDIVAKNRLLGSLPEGVTHIGGASELQNIQDMINACIKG